MSRKVRSWIGVTAILFVCILAGCSTMPKRPATVAPGAYGYTKEYVSWLIRKEMKKHDVEGLSIALVDDQNLVWAEGFGYADRDRNLPASADTVYRVGSISKLFTATAAMQLVEQGKFDLDRPLKTYLPEFSVKSRFPDAAPITPRSIMTHHSGLPSDFFKGMWNPTPEPFENDLREVRNLYAAYPPNYVFSYSNLAVTLLGLAVENVAQRPFADNLAEAVLKPLGMSHSRFAVAPDRSELGARAYREGKPAEELPLRDVPAGGLNSSVRDLSRFMKMVFADGQGEGGEILKPLTLAEMLRPQNTAVPLDLNFRVGLGWMLGGLGEIDIKNAGPVAHHSGATLYHRSMLIVLPEQKLGVVVLANSAEAGTVVNKVAVETLKLALEAKKGILQPEPVSPKTASSIPKGALSGYDGIYATVAGVARVTPHDDYLSVSLSGKSLRLVPREDGLLSLRYRLLGLIPVSLGELGRVGFGRQSVAGREVLKARVGSQEMVVGEKIPVAPLTEKWRSRVGSYQVVNAGDDAVLFDDLRLREEDGILVADYELPLFMKGRLSIALSPVSENEAVVQGLGRGMGETIRVVQDRGVEYLLYSGYRLARKP